MDREERALLATTVGDAVANAGTVTLDTVLADLGWLAMLAAEPRDAIAIVFEALGAANGVASALDDVVVAALGLTPRASLAVLLPPFGTWPAPGRLARGTVDARGIGSAHLASADELLVVCGAESTACAVTIPVAAADVQPVCGIDPDFGASIVRVDQVSVGGAMHDASKWEAAVARGRRAIAHQIAGATRAMLTLARTHALERVQFDRPIARFQAVRHRLADSLVAIEALDATLDAAADAPNPATAALAKATAGNTARTVATHCQQVLAGVGFTTDHAFHRFLKRTMVLDGLLGTADAITVDLGRRLLTTRHVPTLIDL